jgi:hypothetical protein
MSRAWYIPSIFWIKPPVLMPLSLAVASMTDLGKPVKAPWLLHALLHWLLQSLDEPGLKRL